MAISWPTKEQIRASVLALWTAERPLADSTKYSNLWLFSRVSSVLVYRLHRTIAQALNAVFPTTSFESYLDSWLSWLGLPDGQGGFGRILPHISSADSGLECVAAGAIAPNAWNGEFLTDTAGNSYQCTENHAGGPITVDLDVVSVTTGYTVNLETGTVLTWDAPPAGSDATATLVKDMTGGTDLEEDSAGRVRLLSRLRNPPASGNVASWVATIEAVQAGTLKAYVWPQRQNGPLHGQGTTDYMAMKLQENGLDRFILAADDLYTDIDDAADAALPALIYRNSRQLLANGIRVDVDITVELGLDSTADMKCDWDAETIKATVGGNDAGGPEITCSADVCEGGIGVTVGAGLEIGYKVVINGVEGEVTNTIIGGDHATFEVSDWPAGWGTALNSLAGYNVTSGGGFIGQKTDYDNSVTGSGLVGAINDHLDSRGPNVDYGAAQSQIPGWDSSVRIQQLESECFVVGGGNIVEVTIDDLDAGAPGVVDLVHAQQVGLPVDTYYAREITIWQVYV